MSVVCQPREVPRMVQIIHQRLHKHTQILPRIFRPRNYKRQEHGLALHYGIGREIQRNNKYGPTAVWIRRHTIWIEPITCYSNSDIPSLGCFLRVFYIEWLSCFTFWWMYNFIWILPFPFLVPLQHFGRLLGDEKALQSFYKIKIPKNLHRDF